MNLARSIYLVDIKRKCTAVQLIRLVLERYKIQPNDDIFPFEQGDIVSVFCIISNFLNCNCIHLSCFKVVANFYSMF